MHPKVYNSLKTAEKARDTFFSQTLSSFALQHRTTRDARTLPVTGPLNGSRGSNLTIAVLGPRLKQQ